MHIRVPHLTQSSLTSQLVAIKQTGFEIYLAINRSLRFNIIAHPTGTKNECYSEGKGTCTEIVFEAMEAYSDEAVMENETKDAGCDGLILVESLPHFPVDDFLHIGTRSPVKLIRQLRIGDRSHAQYQRRHQEEHHRSSLPLSHLSVKSQTSRDAESGTKPLIELSDSQRGRRN